MGARAFGIPSYPVHHANTSELCSKASRLWTRANGIDTQKAHAQRRIFCTAPITVDLTQEQPHPTVPSYLLWFLSPSATLPRESDPEADLMLTNGMPGLVCRWKSRGMEGAQGVSSGWWPRLLRSDVSLEGE